LRLFVADSISPDAIEIDPLEVDPASDAPDDTEIDPEPRAVETVDITIEPLGPEVLFPLIRETIPPAPDTAAPPSIETDPAAAF